MGKQSRARRLRHLARAMHDAGHRPGDVVFLTADEVEQLRKAGYELEPAPPTLESTPPQIDRRFTLADAHETFRGIDRSVDDGR